MQLFLGQKYESLGLALNILACRSRDLAEQSLIFTFFLKDETLSDILTCSASLLSMPRPLSAISMDFMLKSYVLCAVCVLDQGFSNIF